MASQPGKQTITIHVLPSNSREKDNQTMKLIQLIEHSVRNVFLQNFISYEKLDSFYTSNKYLKIYFMRDEENETPK